MECDEELSGLMMEVCINGGGEEMFNWRLIISGEFFDIEVYVMLYKG